MAVSAFTAMHDFRGAGLLLPGECLYAASTRLSQSLVLPAPAWIAIGLEDAMDRTGNYGRYCDYRPI
jgi:hypothetical protein